MSTDLLLSVCCSQCATLGADTGLYLSAAGARGLMVDFGTDVAPRRAAFYVRQRPEHADMFMYVVLIYVHVTEDTWCIVRHLVSEPSVRRRA